LLFPPHEQSIVRVSTAMLCIYYHSRAFHAIPAPYHHDRPPTCVFVDFRCCCCSVQRVSLLGVYRLQF
jgi:hypothetical protein